MDTAPKVAPKIRSFAAYLLKTTPDGSKAEFDTITGYRKYYFANGKMQMEGKLTKAYPIDYREVSGIITMNTDC